MTDSLGWPARAMVALVFLAFASWAILWHALPWALDRLPLATPVVMFLTIALISIAWATVDVVRGMPANDKKVPDDH